jgi:hypothetical protein
VTFYPAPYKDGRVCIRVRGSPELSEPKEFILELANRKRKVKLVPTGKDSRPAREARPPVPHREDSPADRDDPAPPPDDSDAPFDDTEAA